MLICNIILLEVVYNLTFISGHDTNENNIPYVEEEAWGGRESKTGDGKGEGDIWRNKGFSPEGILLHRCSAWNSYSKNIKITEMLINDNAITEWRCINL